MPVSARTFLPLPKEWSGELGWREWLAGLLGGGFGAFLVVNSIIAILDGLLLRAIFLITAGTAFLALIALMIVSHGGRTRIHITHGRVETVGRSTVVRISRAHVTASILFYGCLVPAGLILAFGTWAGALDLPLRAGETVVFPPVAFGLSLFSLSYLTIYLFRVSMRPLVLDPQGINAPTMRHNRIAWDSIRQIDIGASSSTTAVIQFELKQTHSGPSPRLRIYVESLSIGAPAAFWMLRFYLDHPEFRVELAGNRAAERIRSYALVDRNEQTFRPEGSVGRDR